MDQTILTCKGVCKSFPGVKALDKVDFQLKRGEVHALCGENGAGKSTLIKIITGLYGKDAGVITYEGKEIRYKSVQECRSNGISLIPQEIHLAETLTVAENVCMTSFPKKKSGLVDWNEMRVKTAALQKRIGCDNTGFGPDTIVGNLSMGQQQLIEVMKAISTDLKIIAFDEPTSSLSDDEAAQLFNLIRDLTKKGISIIYVSHRLGEIFEICDRVTVFKDGNYVGTKDIKDVTMNDIVSMMVGRDMAQFKRSKRCADPNIKVLEVEHLTWKKRVRDISFALQKGEILGLFGIVGSGRTETVRTIFGLEKKGAGTIKLNGTAVDIASPREAVRNRIGFVTEDRRGEGLSLISSIEWNITMPFIQKLAGKVGNIRHRKEKETAVEMVKKLSIKAPGTYTQAGTLSGGNQQKIVIAKWLGAQSEILIFDEPTRGIDVGAKAEIYHLMEELVSQGKSIIMISSELPELMALSDRILVYRDGEINAEFTNPEEFTEEEILHYAIMQKTEGTNNEINA